MQNDNLILAIDIGSSNLKIAEFYCAAGNLRMRKFDFRKLDIDPNDGEEADLVAFIRTYNAMIAENGFTAKQVRITLPSKLSFQRLSKLPPIPGSRAAIDKIVEYEARQTVPYAINDVDWGYQLVRHQWEEKRMETQEDGTLTELLEAKEEYEALFVAVKTDLITGYTNVIEDSGKKVISVEIAPIALFNAAMGVQVKEGESTLMLNIGSRSSSLMIADGNRAFIRDIPIAGDTITNQIAKEFNISLAEAEQMKIRHGFVALGGAYEEPDSELAATISKIARNVMTRLHGEVSRSINVWRAQHGGSPLRQVLLSGGSSTMLYMSEFFQEKLRLPVTYLNTFTAIGIEETVDKEKLQNMAPMSQELIGTALHSVTHCPINISLLPKQIRKQYELNARKPYFYATAGVLLACLLLFGFGVDQLLRREQNRVAKAQREVDNISRIAKEIDGLNSQTGAAEARMNDFKRVFQSRSGSAPNSYIKVLTELQRIMPDQMWLVSLEPSDILPPEPVAKVTAEGAQRGEGSGTASAFDPVAHANRDQREIKYLLLRGYTISARNTLAPKAGRMEENYLRKFRNALKNNPIFKEESRLDKNSETENLTEFNIILELKETLRK